MPLTTCVRQITLLDHIYNAVLAEREAAPSKIYIGAFFSTLLLLGLKQWRAMPPGEQLDAITQIHQP